MMQLNVDGVVLSFLAIVQQLYCSTMKGNNLCTNFLGSFGYGGLNHGPHECKAKVLTITCIAHVTKQIRGAPRVMQHPKCTFLPFIVGLWDWSPWKSMWGRIHTLFRLALAPHGMSFSLVPRKCVNFVCLERMLHCIWNVTIAIKTLEWHQTPSHGLIHPYTHTYITHIRQTHSLFKGF